MRNLKVKFKMAVLVAVAVILVVGVGTVGILFTGKLADRSQETYNQNLIPIYLVTEIRANNRAIESFLLENLLTLDSDKSKQLTAEIQGKIEQNNELMNQLKSIEFKNAKFSNGIDEYLSLLEDYRTQRDNIIQLAGKNLNEEGYQVYSGSAFSDSRTKLFGLLDDAAASLIADAKAHNELTLSDAKTSSTVSSLLITAAWVLCIVISIIISRLITKPLKELQALMKRAEEGDLTVTAAYASRDEIGQINQSFNSMLTSLKRMMQGISESTEMLSASSQEMSASIEQTARASQLIAEASGDIAAGFEVQADSITRTTASVQTMAEDIAAVERSSNDMAGLMTGAAASTGYGAEAVNGIITRMSEINASVAATQAIVGNLGSLSEEINTIITTINDIANQTNLLSLNASIEAARAGEHGRGFAVVAEEIRKLAEATGHSSLKVTEIITDIQQQTSGAVDSMTAGSELVARGVAQSEAVALAFAEIQSAIESAVRQTERIRIAVEHVSGESQSVTEAMEQVGEASRKGAEDVQDASAATREQLSAMGEMSMSAQYLATLAEDLQKELARFKL
ncbi:MULTISPECIES: methyl-accepting chemotaxis protein [unclassified Paenibacillus]|uniref:methyl-accepting chemotaxis protein n=1 Tax=unclassified Paenibacillus TaxID=185978 RepID=UPI002404ABAE|nr:MULTISPECIES: methyl-accepting chemotaxis protein [unclassified Paenibacillus]MDH6480888.1 methyl-accepting chemotaxis protein [Paenibacillus sp. PastH-2]MDF9842456.1 methyl-accepting chemotaxis protein [Paenibacillus sp. PastF-2]MDF9849046.1 methyl-accepting chemotaxis protein [Paenibacillus sp. PastM-2]MDF9855616.1 methyl-accepting chemotaxis protein [Paenibacillus sp. PastF-1]MDH6508310.1 methyl-accepting chemotaxis protein [Paenibacillus sp. PastM-3]